MPPSLSQRAHPKAVLALATTLLQNIDTINTLFTAVRVYDFKRLLQCSFHGPWVLVLFLVMSLIRLYTLVYDVMS